MTRGPRFLLLLTLGCVALGPGCSLVLPETSHQPVLHNPFPQLSRVAVAPFFNQSDEPTLDGADFARAYFAQLQAIPGFEVAPVGVVEEAILRHAIDLSSPGEARRLAQVLGVDAVVVGAVTDYRIYYPPRLGLRVEWYAANPGFHPIPAGYGLPWGTPDEEYIPDSLVFEAEMALAREQLATQSPDCRSGCTVLPAPPGFTPPHAASPIPAHEATEAGGPPAPDSDASGAAGARDAASDSGAGDLTTASCVTTGGEGNAAATLGVGLLPTDWPDARGFSPPGPSPVRPPCVPTNKPVMTHTKIYRGADPEFTAALASYVAFTDDARFGGWQSYLERHDDFIRFCAHLHLSEMLSARGGGGETRVVRRWPSSR